MPYLTKHTLYQFVRTECPRQLRLSLSPPDHCPAERAAQGMPPEQPPRPGLEHLAQQGEEWQAEKLDDLTRAFGAQVMVGDPRVNNAGRIRYRPVDLATTLPGTPPDRFIAEAEFEVGQAFRAALDIQDLTDRLGLEYGRLRPDLIQTLPPGTHSSAVSPRGDLLPLDPNDTRTQLRVIDVKLTSEPSPGYFAEVTYYSMALAGWLVDQGRDADYVVAPVAAIWPGSHDASALSVGTQRIAQEGRQPTQDELREFLEEDLVAVPFEVLAVRVLRFFQHDVREVLEEDWRDLEWHVDNRCANCEYLGYPWRDGQGNLTNHPDHCMPEAERIEHLSRIAFVSRGASSSLRRANVGTVGDVAARAPDDDAFDTHHVLRATRTVVAGRARSLGTGQPEIPAGAGTSAVMPRWADLKVYLSADFDIGSGITLALGIKAFWMEPWQANQPQRAYHAWGPDVFVVDQKDVQVERREVLAFLDRIHEILNDARQRHPDTTVQFYVWDSLQFDHLARIIGRHLQAILANQTINYLAWLFPPEEVVPNARLATHRSPVTRLRDVVRAVVAAPVAHYYSLLAVARAYHDPALPPGVARFSVHPLFTDGLSDQIPSERAHEIWARITQPRHWTQQLDTLRETVRRRLSALEEVTKRLQTDLRDQLGKTAPRIPHLGPPAPANRLSMDGQLWFAHARLNQALDELEVQQVRAMPAHEREARFRSARLTRRLRGNEEAAALQHFNLPAQANRRVYELRPGSSEVKLREGDFNFALGPEADPQFLDRYLIQVTENTPIAPADPRERFMTMDRVTQVTVRGIDRERHWIVVDQSVAFAPVTLDDLELHTPVDLSRDVVLDPTHRDTFTRKLQDALTEIGNPQIAGRDPLVVRATGQTAGRGARRSRHSPAADFLWDGSTMHNTVVQRNLAQVRADLAQFAAYGRLTAAQWRAWEAALSRRLQLIWGPPGTGKSETVRAIVLGAFLDAHQRDEPLRVLVCSATYRAIDNVLLDLFGELPRLVPAGNVDLARLRSEQRPPEPAVTGNADVPVNWWTPSPRVRELRRRLSRAEGFSLVGATPHQVHNLMKAENDSPLQNWFDLIVIDEASQMDVATSTLAITSLATDGSVVLAGDPMQLPPIQAAQPPLGLEDMVGSVYTFAERVHGVGDEILDVNFRSNEAIVEFARRSGYPRTLRSFSPDLRISLAPPLPAAPPGNWPGNVEWIPEWAEILNPDLPVTAFVYPEGVSSQWNPFEADVVTALAVALHGRLVDPPDNDNTVHGVAAAPYPPQRFWERAVGVVTPHRAQEALIVERLRQAFAGVVPPGLIRDAVDTVERFQGQERDVMIASYALGDPDAIGQEDEFLLSLNRFNVMASRARAKLIVLVTQQVVDHLSNDLEVLNNSRLLKVFVESYCSNSRQMSLPHRDASGLHQVRGVFRWA